MCECDRNDACKESTACKESLDQKINPAPNFSGTIQLKDQIQNPHLKKLVEDYPQIEYGTIVATTRSRGQGIVTHSHDGSITSWTYHIVGYTGVRTCLPHLSLLAIDSPRIQSAELIEFSERSPENNISTFSAQILLRFHHEDSRLSS